MPLPLQFYLKQKERLHKRPVFIRLFLSCPSLEEEREIVTKLEKKSHSCANEQQATDMTQRPRNDFDSPPTSVPI